MKPNRTQIHAKYNGHCAYCGEPISLKDMQVDHLIPQYWIECGNATADQVHCAENYMPACRPCNKFKDTFSIEMFRSELEAQIDRLRQYRATFRLAERYGLIQCKAEPVVFYFETLNNEEKV